MFLHLESYRWNLACSTTESWRACFGSWVSALGSSFATGDRRSTQSASWQERSDRSCRTSASTSSGSGVVVGAGSRLGFWNLGLLKATVLWTLLSGIGLLAGTTDALNSRGWFWRALFSTIGATAVVEFIVNLRSFPLVVEFMLQPVIFFALVLPVVARDPEHQPVRVVAGWTSALIGFAAIG